MSICEGWQNYWKYVIGPRDSSWLKRYPANVVIKLDITNAYDGDRIGILCVNAGYIVIW